MKETMEEETRRLRRKKMGEEKIFWDGEEKKIT
jgi:hypothetical protein